MSGELITREALERIVRRAAELQASEHDVGDGLTKDQVLSLGKDVGIPARYLQQAMLEEQTRTAVAPARGLWAWLAGPPMVSAHRVVPGDQAAVERALMHWMEGEESLQVKRRYPDRTSWEPKAGAFATIQRALGTKGRRFALATAAEVSGQVTQLESGFCHVQLVADIGPGRNRRLQGAGVVFTLGAAAAGALVLPFGPVALLPAAIMFPVAGLIARHHRVENERVQVALEQVLDRLERGEIRPEHALPAGGRGVSTFVRIADEIRKTFQI